MVLFERMGWRGVAAVKAWSSPAMTRGAAGFSKAVGNKKFFARFFSKKRCLLSINA